jgi:hypothetical protein
MRFDIFDENWRKGVLLSYDFDRVSLLWMDDFFALMRGSIYRGRLGF